LVAGVLVAQDASGGATLVIEKCEMSDAGTFTAKGTNEVTNFMNLRFGQGDHMSFFNRPKYSITHFFSKFSRILFDAK
jgi:hypothetical protein